MSIPFNVAYTGIVQKYEKEIGATRNDVASNTVRLQEFTADVNEALDEYVALAIQSCGRWKFDDSNQTDLPEIVTDIVAGQRNYYFTTDETGNLILDIYKVYAKQSGANQPFYPLEAVDTDFSNEADSIADGLNTTGVPYRYDKKANCIVLDPCPLTSVTGGLKVSINREAKYFTYTDTTRKAGINGLHHKFLYLRPALDYARRNSLGSYKLIESEYLKIIADIKNTYRDRAKDEQIIIQPEVVNSI